MAARCCRRRPRQSTARHAADLDHQERTDLRKPPASLAKRAFRLRMAVIDSETETRSTPHKTATGGTVHPGRCGSGPPARVPCVRRPGRRGVGRWHRTRGGRRDRTDRRRQSLTTAAPTAPSLLGRSSRGEAGRKLGGVSQRLPGIPADTNDLTCINEVAVWSRSCQDRIRDEEVGSIPSASSGSLPPGAPQRAWRRRNGRREGSYAALADVDG